MIEAQWGLKDRLLADPAVVAVPQLRRVLEAVSRAARARRTMMALRRICAAKYDPALRFPALHGRDRRLRTQASGCC